MHMLSDFFVFKCRPTFTLADDSSFPCASMIEQSELVEICAGKTHLQVRAENGAACLATFSLFHKGKTSNNIINASAATAEETKGTPQLLQKHMVELQGMRLARWLHWRGSLPCGERLRLVRN